MTMPKGKNLSQKEIDSMKNAVKDGGIRSIHPDRMEAFADYLVQKLINEAGDEQQTKTCNCTCASGKSSCINKGNAV